MLPVFEIDGLRFQDFVTFATYVSDVMFVEHRWNGNLDALNDMLRGGFGTPDGGFVLRITHGAAARSALGYQETERWFEAHSHTCHPANRDHMVRRMNEARTGSGETLFDMLVDIIRIHGPEGRESEDNVVLDIEE